MLRPSEPLPTPPRPLSDPEPNAVSALFERMYAELCRTSAGHVSGEWGGVTISGTELVHEAYLKVAAGDPTWTDQAHFVALVSRAMRQVLTDRARRRTARKRGGEHRDETLGDHAAADDRAAADRALAVDAALGRLAAKDARLAQVVELRFFAGLEIVEIAEAMGVSERTVARDWARAKAHLRALLV
ncbi:ECF-type sigma factor [Rubrivirga sp. IMCC45206]|uniref:ECF-type sigma factor n=1 Tax=Rubrivirga sp. IMCC45206 TaxID=3391614 RepID=UPI00398FE2F3